MASYLYKSPVGNLLIEENGGFITRIDLNGEGEGTELTPVLKEAVKQLDGYFNKTLHEFSLPVKIEGSPFMERVWEELKNIPYGETATYGEIAALVGKPKAARAVGLACGKNPVPIIIPCHRVIGSGGKLTGFGGGLKMKMGLLELEQKKRPENEERIKAGILCCLIILQSLTRILKSKKTCMSASKGRE